jgi:hypothetical protein
MITLESEVRGYGHTRGEVRVVIIQDSEIRDVVALDSEVRVRVTLESDVRFMITPVGRSGFW